MPSIDSPVMFANSDTVIVGDILIAKKILSSDVSGVASTFSGVVSGVVAACSGVVVRVVPVTWLSLPRVLMIPAPRKVARALLIVLSAMPVRAQICGTVAFLSALSS